MSADPADSGTLRRFRARTLRSAVLQRLFAAALVACSAGAATAIAQPPEAYPYSGAGSAAPPALQLEDQTVTGRVDAVHSPNVDRLLKPQYNLEIERRHSQLVITNRRVRRIAVTDSTIANYVQYSENEISIVGMELGKTDLTFWFEGEETPSIYEVTVIRDASLEEQRTLDFGKLERRLRTLFPNSSVALIPVGAQVLVRGQAYDGEEAQNILQIVRSEVLRTLGRFNDLDNSGGVNIYAASTGGGGFNNNIGGGFNGNQNGFRDIVINELSIPGEFNVQMRVIVAEINRSELRNSGIDWRVIFNDGRQAVGANVGGGFGSTLSGIFENGEIQVFLRWLTSNGTIKLLAEPQIVCISGTGASILAGGEFAVPTIIGLGGGQTTSFRGFGTSLVVTPTVMDRDLIRLMVVPEFSELNANNTVNGIPGTNVKRVQTTVELREGQTFAIGGLISRQTLSEVSRIPLFGDIPLVGQYLFHGKKASEVETELLVVVTPEIVRPMEPDEVPPMPGFNHTHPSDHELWKYSRTEGSPDNSVYQTPPFGSGSLHGTPQGYSLFNPEATHGGFGPPPGPGPHFGGPPVMDGNGPGNPGWSAGPGFSHGPGAGYGQPATGPGLYSAPGYGMPQGSPGPPPVPPVPQGGQLTPQPMPGAAVPAGPQSFSSAEYPPQSNAGPSTAQKKPSLMSRVSSAFRRDGSQQPEKNVRSATWTRPAGR